MMEALVLMGGFIAFVVFGCCLMGRLVQLPGRHPRRRSGAASEDFLEGHGLFFQSPEVHSPALRAKIIVLCYNKTV